MVVILVGAGAMMVGGLPHRTHEPSKPLPTTLKERADFFADAYARNRYDDLAALGTTHAGSRELDHWLAQARSRHPDYEVLTPENCDSDVAITDQGQVALSEMFFASKRTSTGKPFGLRLTIFWIKGDDGQWWVNESTTYSALFVGK